MATLNLEAKKPVQNADRPLTLTITKEHVKRATCKSASACVIAQALLDSQLGMLSQEMEVGSFCTKIVLTDRILRFKTPTRLANALRTYDDTEQWHLPPGEYKLMPYTAAQRRWEEAKRNGGKQSKFKRVISAPSRVTKNIQQLGGMLNKKKAA